ncbi:MAG: hypothetical protein AAFP22_21350 [Planctomycetota bacterium]
MRITILLLSLFLGATVGSAQSARPATPEKSEARAKVLERFDTNGDGQLDDAEKAAAKAARRGAEGQRTRRGKAVRGGERTGKGQRSGKRRGRRGRARGQGRQRALERFDTNGDGTLDETEREALRRAVQERRGEGGARRGRSNITRLKTSHA